MEVMKLLAMFRGTIPKDREKMDLFLRYQAQHFDEKWQDLVEAARRVKPFSGERLCRMRRGNEASSSIKAASVMRATKISFLEFAAAIASIFHAASDLSLLPGPPFRSRSGPARLAPGATWRARRRLLKKAGCRSCLPRMGKAYFAPASIA